jgi:ABC-type lipoprotein release transport system permease subunit
VAHLLVGVTPQDPLTLVIAVVATTAAAAIACLVPSWRAGDADPLDALRDS